MNENASASPLPPTSSISPEAPASSASPDTSASATPASLAPGETSFVDDPLGGTGIGVAEPKEKPLNSKIADIIEKIISHIPDTTEPVSNTPDARARYIVSRSATTAGLVSGGLAIPPGPFAFATLLPDLYAIWKIQSQMIADIAAAYGKKAELRREHMLYCLFRHITSQVARDIAVRVGQRVLIRPGSIAIMNRIFRIVGTEITQRAVARSAGAWVPLFGAAAVGGYAWYDTRVVGHTAIALFSPGDPNTSTTSTSTTGSITPATAEATGPAPFPVDAAATATTTPPASQPLPTEPDPEVTDFDGFVDLPPLPPAQTPPPAPPSQTW